MLCTNIDCKDGGAAAEYCQPHQIIPYLMNERPWVARDNKLNMRDYADYLMNYRSGASQNLFINIHASHVSIYDRLSGHLPELKSAFLLFRRNIVAQAVSYYIASETKVWSSGYEASDAAEPEFDYAKIRERLLALIQGCFDNANRFASLNPQVIIYEDYLEQKMSFARLNAVASASDATIITKKQSTGVNRAFAERFLEMSESLPDTDVRSCIEYYARLVDSLTSRISN